MLKSKTTGLIVLANTLADMNAWTLQTYMHGSGKLEAHLLKNILRFEAYKSNMQIFYRYIMRLYVGLALYV